MNESRKHSIYDLTKDNHDHDHDHHHSTSCSDDEYTTKLTTTNSIKKSSFSQLLLRKAVNLSKRFKYYIIHSVALFNEDLYGLSWSEAHDLLQSTYGITMETNENTSPMNCRKSRHFSTSAIPANSITTSSTPIISRKYSDINSLKKHSRLYQLDKPYFIQCKPMEINKKYE
ncbi:hypothetical protein Smp_148180 [Schistosoma mansoni]|uniref:Uncharacterized protein n=1 Tax=Schistosoma mansoni TaxID=6183 RepID=G4VSA8_SCHMA|nr:hypothetical protein Smp_148180 [Schistosoma mansoni]|eukprot:XP_018654402.1 hypothetical protein Smp_148180 [Schistosoma mansoni]